MDDVSDDETRPLISANVPENEDKGCGSSALCDPHRPLHRYFVLIFICFLSFGNHHGSSPFSHLQVTLRRVRVRVRVGLGLGLGLG